MALITQTEQASLDAAAARFAFVASGARIGADSVVGPHAYVGPLAVVGDRCTVESGAHLCRGTTLEDDVGIGANAAFSAGPPGLETAATVVRKGAWIGANASIGAGIVIGAKALVRPGAVVTRSVPPGAIVEGNPATIVGYVDTLPGPVAPLHKLSSPTRATVETTPVEGVTVHHFPIIPDLRGNLSVGEFERQIPFTPQRYFLVFGVPSREVRGEHAHRLCHQFLICLRGSCAVVADDGANRIEVVLDSPDRGLYLPPMVWGIQYKYTADAMLLVFASHHYDAGDYIRDYADFQQAVGAAGALPA